MEPLTSRDIPDSVSVHLHGVRGRWGMCLSNVAFYSWDQPMLTRIGKVDVEAEGKDILGALYRPLRHLHPRTTLTLSPTPASRLTKSLRIIQLILQIVLVLALILVLDPVADLEAEFEDRVGAGLDLEIASLSSMALYISVGRGTRSASSEPAPLPMIFSAPYHFIPQYPNLKAAQIARRAEQGFDADYLSSLMDDHEVIPMKPFSEQQKVGMRHAQRHFDEYLDFMKSDNQESVFPGSPTSTDEIFSPTGTPLDFESSNGFPPIMPTSRRVLRHRLTGEK
ncbi:hypothetical protein P7C73_g4608, partial [Tremellales sp. Uapishka_1]